LQFLAPGFGLGLGQNFGRLLLDALACQGLALSFGLAAILGPSPEPYKTGNGCTDQCSGDNLNSRHYIHVHHSFVTIRSSQCVRHNSFIKWCLSLRFVLLSLFVC